MAADKAIDSLIEKINSMHSNLVENTWQNLSKNAFSTVLEKTISELNEMKLKVREIKIAFSPHDDAPDSAKILSEFDKTITILERNLQMEKSKSETPKFGWAEESEKPELYSSIEQNVLALILRCRYFVEKCLIFERKQQPKEFELQPTSRALMDLLKQKENEIESLREKYSESRKQSFLGLVAKEGTADLEEELIATARHLESNFNDSKKAEDSIKKDLDLMQHNFADLKQKYSKLHESLENFIQKNSRLTTSLKKEGDYSKKVMVESENETLKLRNTYTREILNLQEAKLIAKKEVEEKSATTMNVLRKELSEKENLLKHFREMSEHHFKKIKELEEQNKKLKLLLNLKEKHEMVLQQFNPKKRKKK